jgi:hypothetical protein
MRIVPRFLWPGQHALASLVLYPDPLADVWIAIRQRNAARFAPSEKSNAILTGQSHIFEVENDSAVFHFRGNEGFQFRSMLFVELAA